MTKTWRSHEQKQININTPFRLKERYSSWQRGKSNNKHVYDKLVMFIKQTLISVDLKNKSLKMQACSYISKTIDEIIS